MSNELIPITEVAERLQCSPSTVRRALAANEIPGGFKVRGRWKVLRGEFEAFMRRGIRHPYIVDISERKQSA